jgi:hypothetical protein
MKIVDSISFPERKIKILNADIELELMVSDEAYEQMLQVFQERDMNPLVRLTLHSESGPKTEFTQFRSNIDSFEND